MPVWIINLVKLAAAGGCFYLAFVSFQPLWAGIPERDALREVSGTVAAVSYRRDKNVERHGIETVRLELNDNQGTFAIDHEQPSFRAVRDITAGDRVRLWVDDQRFLGSAGVEVYELELNDQPVFGYAQSVPLAQRANSSGMYCSGPLFVLFGMAFLATHGWGTKEQASRYRWVQAIRRVLGV